MTGQRSGDLYPAMIGTPTAVDRERHAVAPSPGLYGATDIGRVRRQNQDAFGFSADGRILVVADGMGGHDFGDVASSHAVEAVLGCMVEECGGVVPGAAAERGEVLLRAMHCAHEKLVAEVDSDPLRRRMGTTLLVAWLCGDMVHTCHVGDSRAYVLTPAGLHQLTRDHSVVEMLVRTGQITAGQARFHPRKNELTQAVGLSAIIGPTLNEIRLDAGDRLLLCSDGLWGPLPPNEMEARLATPGETAEAGRRLVDGANLFGGGDNITVVVYEHGRGEG